jgi:hypothetical protein
MAFWSVCNAAQGVGSRFDGLAMVTAAGTPVAGLPALVYLPKIALTAVFRSSGGVVVERNAAASPLERTINA